MTDDTSYLEMAVGKPLIAPHLLAYPVSRAGYITWLKTVAEPDVIWWDSLGPVSRLVLRFLHRITFFDSLVEDIEYKRREVDRCSGCVA